MFKINFIFSFLVLIVNFYFVFFYLFKFTWVDKMAEFSATLAMGVRIWEFLSEVSCPIHVVPKVSKKDLLFWNKASLIATAIRVDNGCEFSPPVNCPPVNCSRVLLITFVGSSWELSTCYININMQKKENLYFEQVGKRERNIWKIKKKHRSLYILWLHQFV